MRKKILIGICIIVGALLIFEGYYYISSSNKTDKVTTDTSDNSTDTDTSNDSNNATSNEEYLNDLEENLNTAISTLDDIENTETSLSSEVE